MKIIFLLLITLNSIFAIKIFDVTDTTAKINITNLNEGHTGVIIKEIDGNTLITKIAQVIKSDEKSSTIEFLDDNILPQDAIPTTKLVPQNGDKFILNHLYKTSLLIVPNLQAKNSVKKLYPNQNFLSEDFFAAHLKILKQPIPEKETISNFAQSQQIGTIFFVIKNKLYIVDSITFKTIDTISLNYNDDSIQVPFLTKIENIDQGLLDFGDDEIEDYNTYYLKLLETK